MAVILETPNPFEPLVGLRKHVHLGGLTIREWLERTYPGFVEFDQPTICLVNGQPVLRKDWDRKIKRDDVVNFIAIVGEVATIIAIVIAVVTIIAAIALVLMMPKPGEGPPESDPVYSTKGQTNAIRLGEPIEVCYGRNRIYPSLASRPFFQYINNDQFQHSLFCIGQGVYDIEAIQIGDTAIANFEEVTWEVIPPGSQTTLFKTNVHTSVEAGGQELLAPNVGNVEEPKFARIYYVQRTSNVVTVTVHPGGHGFSTGDHVQIFCMRLVWQAGHGTVNVAAGFDVDDAVITVIDASSFTYPLAGVDKPPILVDFSSYAILLDVVPVEWVGPFPANLSGTEITRIEADFTFPRGLYTIDKKGKVKPVVAVIEVMARLIDDSGDPLGDWFMLLNPTVEGATTTPQRRTFGQDVDLGRYEVRARRSNAKNLDTNAGNDVFWEGMRGFISGGEPDFGDVTLLAVRIRATNNLNQRTQERFNVIATRKLPIRESGGFSDPVVTRSIVWAFIDVFRSNYGGRITNEDFFDWEALEALDAFWEARNEHFDWIFRDPATIWSIAQIICRVGRSLPLVTGSVITIKRDGPLEVPVALFGPDNIVKESFQWDIKLWEPGEHDSVSIEYTDPSTGYKQEIVTATLPGGTTDYPEDVRFPGIQDRNHAYREGLYMLASERYLRENISFETGMEGFLPSYGDLVAVSYDVPRWGQSGYILAVEEDSAGITSLYVSEPLNFDESGQEYQILLRGRQGQVIGPVTAEPTDDPKVVTVTLAEEVDFLLGGTTEPMIFLFGLVGEITKYCRVVKIEPQGGERVRITVVNDAPVIHSFDGLEAPLLTFPSVPPPVPDLPIVSQLFLSQVDGAVLTIQASWMAAYGAQTYIVQTSQDGENWQFRAETSRTSIQLQTPPGDIYVRVAAMNNGQGPWKEETIKVGLIFGLENHIPWTALEWGVRWLNDVNVDAYLIKVYDIDSDSNGTPILKRTVQQEGTEFIYTYAMAVEDDNTVNEMRVTVDAMIYDLPTQTLEAYGAPRSLDLFNAVPLPPEESSIGYEYVSTNLSEGTVTYRVFWTNPIAGDSIRVEIWLSDVNGFDPLVDVPVLDFTSSSPGSAYAPVEAEVVVPLDAGNVHPDWYFRIAVGDVWSSGSGISDQETISPPWILADATWADEGRWEDGEDWND